MLPPAELYEKYLMVIDATCRFLQQVPTEKLTHSQADRPERTFRNLGIHVMQIAAVFVDSHATGRLVLSGRKLPEGAAESWTGSEIGAYGAQVRRDMVDWWETSGSTMPMDTPMEDNWGIRTVHHTMERQAWHAAQHARQIMMFLDQLGIAPNHRLSGEDLAGLPLPDDVWI